jgi:DNA-directed RNA polymerase specialized sigma24 family protein
VADAAGEFAEYAASRWLTLVRSAVLLGCTVSEAEDVAQEALTRCLVGWTKVTGARHRDAYVSAILLNCFRDSRRGGWRQRERPVAEVPDGAGPDLTGRADTAMAVETALGTLTRGSARS